MRMRGYQILFRARLGPKNKFGLGFYAQGENNILILKSYS